MATRQRVKVETGEASVSVVSNKKNSYFVDAKPNLEFVSSGCTVLDCILGGGYCLGRIVNIVGDKSTAKTGLATEALINFTNVFHKGRAAYREVEAAFDAGYANAMGLDLDKVDLGDPENPILTVEDFARDLEKFTDEQIKADEPGLYILDSFDALSDEAEQENDIGKGTYGAAKAKQSSVMFRKLARKIERSKVLLIIISQVRDNIGVSFGEKYRRSGGKALDFYASQILWLAHMGYIKRTINKIERPIGIEVRGKVKKNKVSLPMRECDFPFMFGFGIDDIAANVEWLAEVNRLSDIQVKQSEKKDYLRSLEEMPSEQYAAERKRVSDAVKLAWREIETTFLPSRSKYGAA
jgi:protein RecA